jgi:hypothetical protein
MATPEASVAPMSRRLPADGVPRTGTMSSEGRVASPRASSSLGPDETSAWKASVPGAGLLYWLAGGGVRAARERPMGDPAGGGASHVPLPGPDSAGFEAGRPAKGSVPTRPWLAPGWEPAALPGCSGAPPVTEGSGGATRGGPKPGEAAAIPDGTETGAGVAAGRSARDMVMAGDMGAPRPRPAGEDICDEARGGPAAGRMTVTAPMT